MTHLQQFRRNTAIVWIWTIVCWIVFFTVIGFGINLALSASASLLSNPLTWSLRSGPQPTCLTIHTLSTPPTRIYAAVRLPSNPYSAFAPTLDLYDPAVSNTNLSDWTSTIHAICPGAQK